MFLLVLLHYGIMNSTNPRDVCMQPLENRGSDAPSFI